MGIGTIIRSAARNADAADEAAQTAVQFGRRLDQEAFGEVSAKAAGRGQARSIFVDANLNPSSEIRSGVALDPHTGRVKEATLRLNPIPDESLPRTVAPAEWQQPAAQRVERVGLEEAERVGVESAETRFRGHPDNVPHVVVRDEQVDPADLGDLANRVNERLTTTWDDFFDDLLG